MTTEREVPISSKGVGRNEAQTSRIKGEKEGKILIEQEKE